MKRPALLIAFCAAAGILGGPIVAPHLPHALPTSLAAAALILAVAFFLHAAQRDTLAWTLSLLAWCLLGATAAIAEPLAVPANQVTHLVASNQLDLSEPLRWHGQLRADPLRLPWGLSYVIDLQEAQSAGQWMRVTGGLRASYYFDERASGDPPAVRAGDSVEVLMRGEPVRNFGDPGAFDYNAYLGRQQIQLIGTLRNASLITPIPGPPPSVAQRIARVRGNLIREVDTVLANDPGRAAVARAMLLGDRSFLDSEQIEPFQQTGSYHVLVIAGLHVGMLAFALLWFCRRLRLSLWSSTLVTIAGLAAYVAIVEDRPPILRAALMATAYLLARLMFRRTELLNVIGLAALLLLLFRPSELSDASFQLSFLAALTIAGVAAPLLQASTEKYVRGLSHLGDVTRDPAQIPRVAQFRLDLRSASNWLGSRLPTSLSRFAPSVVTAPCRVALRVTEMVVISVALQIGLLPLMAQHFHRLSVVAPVANVPRGFTHWHHRSLWIGGVVCWQLLAVARAHIGLRACGGNRRVDEHGALFCGAIVEFLSRSVAAGGCVGIVFRYRCAVFGCAFYEQAMGGLAGVGCFAVTRRLDFDLSVCAASPAWAAGNYCARRRTGRFHLRGVSEWQDDAGGWRRSCRRLVHARRSLRN